MITAVIVDDPPQPEHAGPLWPGGHAGVGRTHRRHVGGGIDPRSGNDGAGQSPVDGLKTPCYTLSQVMIVKTLILKEAQAPYTLTLDEVTLAEGPVRVLRGEQTIGVLVPPDEYKAFRAWRETQERRARMQQAHEQFEHEVAAFERMLPDLLQEYRGRVVAIHNGQVVEVGDSKIEVSERVHQRLGDVIVYIQRALEYPRIYKFPYFKVVR